MLFMPTSHVSHGTASKAGVSLPVSMAAKTLYGEAKAAQGELDFSAVILESKTKVTK
jgi:3-hydroxyisobutyrate dehydrogenase-like beta-hydroxyacid dehydrogenase